MWNELSAKITSGDRKSLARCISLIENEVEGYDKMLESLPVNAVPVTGITGPPGAGKSTITDQLINLFIANNKKVAVLCIDPSSPFHKGALLGDRIRMNRWYDNPSVFIRSLAGKDSFGGLSPKAIEITDLFKAAGFDHIIIETIGVGQNEMEIAGLADTTVVVLVPEAGDDVQTMKAGLLEIADIFAVNKSDRPGADIFIKHLRGMPVADDSQPRYEIPVIKMIATKNIGTQELSDAISENLTYEKNTDRKNHLLAEKVYRVIQSRRMKDVSKKELIEHIKKDAAFNFYKFVNTFK